MGKVKRFSQLVYSLALLLEIFIVVLFIGVYILANKAGTFTSQLEMTVYSVWGFSVLLIAYTVYMLKNIKLINDK